MVGFENLCSIQEEGKGNAPTVFVMYFFNQNLLASIKVKARFQEAT